LETVGELHHNNIIHKNINPVDSIFINSATGQVKITNFGIASQISRENQIISNPGMLEGVLAYMSPEQTGRMNRPVDYRTDFYSLGITFYEMLTGVLPFPAVDPLELVHCHIAKQPVSPHELDHTIPGVVSDIVMKLLSKNAEDRYQSAYGIKVDLEECASQWGARGKVEKFSLGQSDVCDQFQIPQKLYGREAEIATLMAAFDRVSQGKTEMMLVYGYAGIGKSALVNEIHKSIVRQRGYFVSGKFDQFKRDLPYSSLIQAFQELVRQLLTESEQQIAMWRAKLLDALGSVGRVITDVIPEVELIIGKQPLVPQVGLTESQNRFNLVFQKFIRVFAQKEHPVAIFMDDLQWGDSASLNLIRLLVTDPDSHYLLMIGAYRDNEISATHPLMLTCEKIEIGGATVNRISLAPLSLVDLTLLIANTCHTEEGRSRSLAELVFNKTGGNPFFVREFLKALYQKGLLVFAVRGGCWEWDFDQILAAQITDNVAELMVSRIQKLTVTTQSALKFAACIGNRFDLNTLSVIYEKPLREAASDLSEAVREGLILPIDISYRLPRMGDLGNEMQVAVENLPVLYEFLHDRVQQAAYSLIPESHRKATHLKIGQLMLGHIAKEKLEEEIFVIANHLNFGIDLIDDQSQRYEFARLNLAAGRKAKAATAYEPALKYLAAGMEFLSESSWQEQYDLTFALHMERAECEYLIASFAKADKLFAIILRNVRTTLDRVAVHSTRMRLFTHLNKYRETVETGVAGLKLLGLELSTEPGRAAMMTSLLKVQWNRGRRKIDALGQLPDTMTAETRAAMNLLMNMWGPTFLLKNWDLCGLVVLTMVNLSLKYGNANVSPVAYAAYGALISSVLGRVESGYKFGTLALKLTEESNDLTVKCRVLFIFSTFLVHHRLHLKGSIEYFKEGLRASLESGDLVYAGFFSIMEMFTMPVLDYTLNEVYEESQKYLEFGKRLGSRNVIETMQVVQRWVSKLRGPARNDSPAGGYDFDVEKDIIEEQQKGQYYLFELQLCYLFERHHDAIEMVERLKENGTFFDPSIYFVPFYYLYYSLTLTALYPTATVAEKRKYWKILRKNQREVKKRAANRPENFLHKYLLISAEMARITGKSEQATDLYDRAIASAHEHDFTQIEAAANELAAKFYLEKGKDKLAKPYLLEARYGYLRWGANAKVEALDEKYTELLTRTSAEINSAGGTMVSGDANRLDWESVMKAARAISGEIVLDKLLIALMKIALENAGAQRGLLILEKESQLVIEAEGAVNRDEVTVLQSVPVGTSSDLPTTVVHYVERTKEPVVLGDATQEDLFATDPYITTKQPRSILCTPLVKQGELIGILYLENNLVTGAFTPDRLDVINLLAAQAAISIENADLYRSLEASKEQLENYSKTLELKVEQRTHELQNRNLDLELANEQVREANRRKSQFLAGMSHELRTPMNAIIGFTRLVLRRTGDLLPGRQRDNLVKVIESANQLLNLINQLLDLSRLEAGRMQVHPERFDVRRLLLDCCEMVAPLIKPGVYLQQAIADTVGEVYTDEEGLRHVVLNLVSNAIKFTDSGEVVVRAWVNNGQVNGDTSLRIAVSDTGIGIPADALETIFEEFQQVEGGVRKREGTGLGLPIAKRWVGLLGGSIAVESEPRKGSTFTVTVPVTYRKP
jgi:predicted ATPase/signal transduction histidine kinase